METADTLKIKFNCAEDTDLGKIFNRSGSAVSVWRKKGLPSSIKERANELMKERGIVSEPKTPYESSKHDDDLHPDEIEKILIRMIRERGKGAAARFVAELLDEEEKKKAAE
ncbi:MAG: hypothetical protein HGB32_15350 [Geobacteraceae bacterium]|nr:hypothetical protein [Geobacteraceae bacterium]NTW81499.1 hypothetical protein [Geobacteraceae bacterium]